jgi:hypothetical protein
MKLYSGKSKATSVELQAADTISESSPVYMDWAVTR